MLTSHCAAATVTTAEKVKGTEWLEVVCDDGKKYYYHSRTGETSWQVPPEVEAQLKVKVRRERSQGAREPGSQGARERGLGRGSEGWEEGAVVVRVAGWVC